MHWYRCLVRGENFPGSLIDRDYEFGFYATRWIEADDEATAETAVVNLLRTDAMLVPGKSGEKSAAAKVHIERIVLSRPQKDHGRGFTLFEMNDAVAEAAAKDLEVKALWR